MKGLESLMSEAKAPDSSKSSESQEAAEDILEAIASKDAKALDLALQRHYACCDDDEGYKDDSDEEA